MTTDDLNNLISAFADSYRVDIKDVEYTFKKINNPEDPDRVDHLNMTLILKSMGQSREIFSKKVRVPEHVLRMIAQRSVQTPTITARENP